MFGVEHKESKIYSNSYADSTTIISFFVFRSFLDSIISFEVTHPSKRYLFNQLFVFAKQQTGMYHLQYCQDLSMFQLKRSGNFVLKHNLVNIYCLIFASILSMIPIQNPSITITTEVRSTIAWLWIWCHNISGNYSWHLLPNCWTSRSNAN